MVSLVSPLQITGAGLAASSNGSRTTVPVSPSSYIYSQFKHVSGVPAPKGVRGVAITKITILNTMIEHLIKARQEKNIPNIAPEKMSDGQLDFFIKKLHNVIESATATNLAIPYTPNPQVAVGTLFNIAA